MQMTQAELAQLIGVSQHTISQWETGKRQIDYHSFEKLCINPIKCGIINLSRVVDCPSIS